MSIKELHTSIPLIYGIQGKETVIQMESALKAYSLDISYDGDSGRFTILESAGTDTRVINSIFSTKAFQGWKPVVLDETDKEGNRLIELQLIEP